MPPGCCAETLDQQRLLDGLHIYRLGWEAFEVIPCGVLGGKYQAS